MRFAWAVLVAVVLGAACSDNDPAPSSDANAVYPDVVAVEVTEVDDRVFDFAVTLSSPYDTPERYADAWRILGPQGEVLGIRELMHDHASEQPFTRSLHGVNIDPGVDEVTIEGRDQVSGWGGATVTVTIP